MLHLTVLGWIDPCIDLHLERLDPEGEVTEPMIGTQSDMSSWGRGPWHLAWRRRATMMVRAFVSTGTAKAQARDLETCSSWGSQDGRHVEKDEGLDWTRRCWKQKDWKELERLAINKILHRIRIPSCTSHVPQHVPQHVIIIEEGLTGWISWLDQLVGSTGWIN